MWLINFDFRYDRLLPFFGENSTGSIFVFFYKACDGLFSTLSSCEKDTIRLIVGIISNLWLFSLNTWVGNICIDDIEETAFGLDLKIIDLFEFAGDKLIDLIDIKGYC